MSISCFHNASKYDFDLNLIQVKMCDLANQHPIYDGTLW